MTAHQPCTGANAASRRPPSSALCCCGAGGGVRSPAVSPGRIRSSVLIRNSFRRWGRPERLSRDSLRTDNGLRLMGAGLGIGTLSPAYPLESRKTLVVVSVTFFAQRRPPEPGVRLPDAATTTVANAVLADAACRCVGI